LFDVLGQVHWIGVLVGWIAYTALGAVWFTALFPRAYNVSLGRETNAAPSKAPIFMIGPTVCGLFITVATSVLMYSLHIGSYRNALLFAMIAGIGYLAANTTTIAINPNFPRPLLYALISGTYNVVGMVIVSLLVVAFR
jgi:hypothetical protein